MKKHKIATIEGYGRLTGPAQNGVHTVEVTTAGGGGAAGEISQVKAKNVILATGSEAKMLPGLEADSRILTNIEILSLNQVPKSLMVIGAGAVGDGVCLDLPHLWNGSYDCGISAPGGSGGGRGDFQGADAPLQEARHRREHRRAGGEGGEDRRRREGDLYRRERQDPGEGSRKGAGRRGARGTYGQHRRGEDGDRARPRASSRSTRRKRRPSRASSPSATSWPACRNWPTWAP